MTEIYPTISLSTHNGDDTPQNYSASFERSSRPSSELKKVHTAAESANRPTLSPTYPYGPKVTRTSFGQPPRTKVLVISVKNSGKDSAVKSFMFPS